VGEHLMHRKTKEELIVIAKHLLKEIEILQDENESLWDMLSEIRESDKAAKKLTDEQREKVMLEFLTKMDAVGDA
jgi:hypothetical protein|tara:strand:- start:138 stop:362 length:225 start_codon:yes stop_codon:yes gene_type:complete